MLWRKATRSLKPKGFIFLNFPPQSSLSICLHELTGEFNYLSKMKKFNSLGSLNVLSKIQLNCFLHQMDLQYLSVCGARQMFSRLPKSMQMIHWSLDKNCQIRYLVLDKNVDERSDNRLTDPRLSSSLSTAASGAKTQCIGR